MPVTGEQAIAAASSQSAHGPRFGVDQCLMRCRLAFGVKAIVHDAAMSWRMSKTQHPTTDPASIPRGVPVYWTGGSSGFGHIAISAGDGKCWSTDIKRGGYFDLVDIAQISRQWPKLKLVGWSETLNGERVYTASVSNPATPVTPAPRPVTSGQLRVDGVDLSHHNTITQAGLAAAKNAGVRWVMHKCTEGATVKDARYSTRRGMVTKAGLMFGAYHFARPSNSLTDALTEAKFFLKTAQVRPGDMRPMLDLEDRGGLTRKQLTAWVGAFVTEVKAQTGVLPYIYTPFDLDDTFGCMLWVARYSNNNAAPKIPAPWKKARIRQFSNGVFGKPNKVAGLGGVDLNMMVEEGPDEPLDWHRVASKDVQPAPAPTPDVTPPLVVSVSSSNIKSNPTMSATKVASDISKVAKLPKTGARVWFGQEIVKGRYRDAWVKGIDGDALCTSQECPITLGTEWTGIEATVAKMHNGLLHVTPARYLSIVQAVSIARPDIKVAFVNTHFISGAWSNNYPKTKTWRRARWSSHWVQMQDTVTRLHDLGYTVIAGADTNRTTMPPLHAGQIVPVEHGIDHLWVIPAAGRTVKVTGHDVLGGLFTDHNAISATLEID